MAKGLCAFQIRSEPKDVNDRVRRALGQIDVGSNPIRRVMAAAERLKLKAIAPVYQSDCLAHVGIEKLKVAIYSKENLEYQHAAEERELWEKHGWALLAISRRKISRLSDAQLTEQLRLALVELGKLKR
jgi:hypothetical protein